MPFELHLSSTHARLNWKTLIEEDPDTQDIIYDKKGKDGSLRVAVPVADMVRLSNFTEDSKEYVESRTEKNLDAAAQEARQNEIFSNHNSEEAVSRAAKIARRSAGGNAFLGKAFDLDFDELQNAVSEKDTAEADEEDDNDSKADAQQDAAERKGSEGGSPAKSGPGKAKAQAKKQAWDRATVVASKIRAETTAICALQLQMKIVWMNVRKPWLSWAPRASSAMRKSR